MIINETQELGLRPNHSLKLTESTAGFSPRENNITMTTYITDTRNKLLVRNCTSPSA
jgi:hypothetical protein